MHVLISIGVIEGSEEALHYETCYVDAKAYGELSHRRHHVFSTNREKLYALFQAYMKVKKTRGEFDTADR